MRITDIKIDPRDKTCASLFAAAEYNGFNQESPLAQGGLYHSADRGLNWTKVTLDRTIRGVNSIVIDQSNRIYITTGYRAGGNGVWYSDDWGTTWNQIFSYPGAQNIDVSPFDRNLLVVSVKHLALNPGIYVSRDRGITWTKSNNAIVIPQQIEQVKFDQLEPSKLWAATLGCGFYRGTIKDGDKVQVVDITENGVESANEQVFKLNASIVNADYAQNTLIWKSENTAIATVDANGLVTPTGKGMTKIWAMTQDSYNFV